MAQPRVLVIGGGLAGLSATMRLAELGVGVDLVSLVPVKRSHSVCAQGGINSCNDATRQLGDSEWLHFGRGRSRRFQQSDREQGYMRTRQYSGGERRREGRTDRH